MILYQVSPNFNSLAHSIDLWGLDTSLITTKASSQNDLLWLAEERQAEMHWVSDVALAAFAVATSGDCNGACAGLTVFAVGHFVLRRPRRSSTPAPVQPVPQANPSPRPIHERADQLRDAIAQLPAEQQHVVQLRFIERRSLQETAVCTGFSCDEIKSIQYQALTALVAISSATLSVQPSSSPPDDSTTQTLD